MGSNKTHRYNNNDKKKKKKKKKRSTDDSSDNSRSFNVLLSIFQSPQGMKIPILKGLYSLLDQLSSNAQWRVKCEVGSHDFDLQTCPGGINVSLGDICELSNILFKELEERFEQFLRISWEVGSSHVGVFDAVEGHNLLLRCCMLLLTFLDDKQNLLLEKGQILLRMVRKLISPNLVEDTRNNTIVFEKSVFRECAHGDNGCTTTSSEDFTASLQFLEPQNPHHFLMCTMLEVFVDELLVHGQLKGYFNMINAVASTSEMLFNPHYVHGDNGVLNRAICDHFILSFSDQAFGEFLSRLFYVNHKELRFSCRAPTICVTAAVSLLLSPIMISAPKYMQAHLISLVSEAADIKSLKPDRRLINCFLSAFEKSVILYMTHISCLQIIDFSKSSSSQDTAHPPFDFYVSPETKSKVDSLITKLDHSSNTVLNDSFCSMKSDLVSSSMRFLKECQNVYAMSCQDEILALLSCLVLKASEEFDDKALSRIEDPSLQHIFLLSSLLKLMSISLLQAIRCLRLTDDSSPPKTLKDFSSCKEHNFILGIAICFRDLELKLPLQQVLYNMMSSHSTRHSDSKMMFLHFSGLMSLSFVSGFDCLVKGCLLTILALLNLFIFEDGGLDALQSIVVSNKESFSSDLPIIRFQETVVDQNSSLVVASKFQKIRSLFSSAKNKSNNELEALDSQTSARASSHLEVAAVGLEEETEETSNGEVFLNCMLKKGEEISDFDDIVGFVECKKGKNYSSWLKNRERYRRWRFGKMAILKWKRRKKTWRKCKGKRN